MKTYLYGKLIFISIAITILGLNPASAQLGTDTFVNAFDDTSSTNYPGGNWTDGSNGGNGFGNWTLSSNGGGSYIGTTGQSTQSFGLFSDGVNNFSYAERAFNRPLQPGDTFSVDLGHTTTINGEVFVQLRSGSSAIITLVFISGDDRWRLNDGGSNFDSGQFYDDYASINFSFTYEGGNTYSYTFGTGSGSNFTANNNLSNITSVRFQSSNQGSGENFGFNNLQVESKYTIPNGQSSSVTSNTTVPYLEVQNGGSVVVEANNVLKVDGDIINDGNITFKSNATGSAQFDTFTGSMNGSGNVTVERHIPAKRAYRFISSSISSVGFGSINSNWQEGATTGDYNPNSGFGTHITGTQGTVGTINTTTGLDETATGNPSLFTFDNTDTGTQGGATGAWVQVTNTLSTDVETETPYLFMVRGDRSIDLGINNPTPTATVLRTTGTTTYFFRGSSSLDTDTNTVSSTGKTAAQELSNEVGYFSFVANPYQAVVDFREVNKSNLTNFIYIWEPNIGGVGSLGGYATVNLSTNASTTGGSANALIPPGGAFFVENATSSPTITFEEDDKAVNQTQASVFNDNPLFSVNASLYASSDFNSGNTMKDAVMLMFSEDFTTPGSSEDAGKMFNHFENIAIINNGLRAFDLQNMPQAGHQVQLWIDGYTETDYTLAFNIENQPQDKSIYLQDNYMNTLEEVVHGFTYNFTVDANIPASAANDRFSVVFENTTLGIDSNSFNTGISLYPNPAQNGIFSIKTPDLNGKVKVEISNILGQQVFSKQLSVENNSVDVQANGLSAGLYFVILSQNKQSFSAKLIVE